ncbi:MAG: electron transfer flavoprotein subunit alpha/FixB family protein [Sulfobacillus sp.]|nr:electron transfer flavoprotein subunit alpha/FixB family protein [Sulfobacillus sp.]
MGPIVVVGELDGNRLQDATKELLTKARELAGGQVPVVVVGFGAGAEEALAHADADEAIAVTGSAVESYNPRVYEMVMHRVIADKTPSAVLLSNSTLGMDLGASLAALTGQPMVAYATGITHEDGHWVVQSQVYGGKLVAEVEAPDSGAVVTVVPGSWKSDEKTGSPSVTVMEAGTASGVQVVRVIEAESGGDVDITRADILVSVGRGLQDPDNLELADELAAAIGGVVSCSRPVVDAGWLPRSRQVGKSGQTVKPKLYLAFGISGAPEHLQGMKDSDLIIALNSDPNAPIFEVAHYGATVDILEFMPALTERLRGEAG